MFASALRTIACAGALATGLLFGVICVPTALADTDNDSGGVGTESSPDPGPVDGVPGGGGAGVAGGSGGGSPDGTNHPTSTIGNGRNDVVDPNAPIENGGDKPGGSVGGPPAKYQPLVIPVLRIPTWEEFAAPGMTPLSAYFGTVEIPTIGDFLTAFSQPEPQPTPGPAFRTQQEAPVADATPGGGGGIDEVSGAAGDGPSVVEAPLVVAPPIPPAFARLAPLGASAARGPAEMTGAQTAVAGARTPLIRGSLPPSSASGARELTPMSGQATRVGYPRYLRNPTVGELSVVALPGVAGLMFFTFSGGVIGYRQANSARFIRTSGAARFLE